MLLASLGLSLIFIAIWAVVIIGSIYLVIKLQRPHRNIKPDKKHLSKLTQALANNWIRVNIKDTKYQFSGNTTVHESGGSPLSETSIYGGIDRQVSDYKITKTERYNYRIISEFIINDEKIKSISHEIQANPVSIKMFCESGLFDILVNPNDYSDTVWQEL